MPLERIREFFNDSCNLPLSEGSVYNIIDRISQKALSVYNKIKQVIAESKVVGTDETGVKTNGKMNWGGTWQTKNATFIAVSPNRGPQTIKENFPEGIKNAVLVHDCWKPHFKTGTQSHQLCLPDMFRELKYMGERFRHSWPTEVRKVFNDAINLKKRFKRYDYVPKQAIQIPTIHLSILISP